MQARSPTFRGESPREASRFARHVRDLWIHPRTYDTAPRPRSRPPHDPPHHVSSRVGLFSRADVARDPASCLRARRWAGERAPTANPLTITERVADVTESYQSPDVGSGHHARGNSHTAGRHAPTRSSREHTIRSWRARRGRDPATSRNTRCHPATRFAATSRSARSAGEAGGSRTSTTTHSGWKTGHG